MVLFGQKLLCFDKVVVFRQSNCVRVKWLYSGKVVVFGQKRFYSGKVVVFGQSGCIRGRWLYLSENGCIWAEVVVFGQT